VHTARAGRAAQLAQRPCGGNSGCIPPWRCVKKQAGRVWGIGRPRGPLQSAGARMLWCMSHVGWRNTRGHAVLGGASAGVRAHKARVVPGCALPLLQRNPGPGKGGGAGSTWFSVHLWGMQTVCAQGGREVECKHRGEHQCVQELL